MQLAADSRYRAPRACRQRIDYFRPVDAELDQVLLPRISDGCHLTDPELVSMHNLPTQNVFCAGARVLGAEVKQSEGGAGAWAREVDVEQLHVAWLARPAVSKLEEAASRLAQAMHVRDD